MSCGSVTSIAWSISHCHGRLDPSGIQNACAPPPPVDDDDDDDEPPEDDVEADDDAGPVDVEVCVPVEACVDAELDVDDAAEVDPAPPAPALAFDVSPPQPATASAAAAAAATSPCVQLVSSLRASRAFGCGSSCFGMARLPAYHAGCDRRAAARRSIVPRRARRPRVRERQSSMPTASLVEGHAALDVIVNGLAPKLVETWPGDEELVGMLVQEGDRVAVIWTDRARIVSDLAQRGTSEQDAHRRRRYESAVAALEAPRAPGKISILVAGWGDMSTIELEAEDLRAGLSLTSFQGGSA
jgi:hypothetical protein